jgi:hypothetical protein
MDRKAVESKTGMCGIGYDPATQVLEIEFKSRKEGEPNKLYHYIPVTQKHYDDFMAAESKGSHFIKNIKPIFACTKVSERVPNAEAEA